jgi:hypothetical protein
VSYLVTVVLATDSEGQLNLDGLEKALTERATHGEKLVGTLSSNGLFLLIWEQPA